MDKFIGTGVYLNSLLAISLNVDEFALHFQAVFLLLSLISECLAFVRAGNINFLEVCRKGILIAKIIGLQLLFGWHAVFLLY